MRKITISVGESRRSTNWTPREVTWEQLCRKLQTPVRTSETMADYAAMSKDQRAEIKDVGGYVGGRIESGHRKAGNISDRQLICLDADFADESLWDVWELMVGKAALMHSSHSSTPEMPRFRLVIPLSRPVSAAEYEPIARRLAEWVGIDAFDDTTYEAERLMYWGSCCADAEYVFRKSESEDWVNPDEVLATYEDWHDMRQWPTSSRQTEVVAKMGKTQGDPLTKPGVVGAFNRAYRITEAIEKFLPDVYSPTGDGRWTYNGGTTTGGAVTYDDDTFIYSHHDTDPISRRLCNAFDMVRLHLFGHLDTGSDADFGNLPSVNEMKRMLQNDDKVGQELASSVTHSDPGDVFEDAPETGRIFDGDLSEQNFAARFVEYCNNCLRYSKPFGWMFWDSTRWVTDADMEANLLIQAFNDRNYADAVVQMRLAATKEDKARAKAVLQAVTKMKSAPSIAHLREIAKAKVYDRSPESYDANAWQLNTPGGIVDLRTGDIQRNDPRFKHTKCTACTPGGNGAEKWLSFVDYVSGGDQGLAEYLQTLCGMAAVGAVYEEGLVITYGDGGNGKSTFFDAISRVLGDYAKAVNADVLVANSYGKVDQSYIAALRGVRLAVLGETDEGAMMGAAQLKRITSRDVISARALYKDPIEFTPAHTTVMHTNHLPRLGSLDGGVKRRIAVAPFTATLPEGRVIKDYSRVLTDECGPAILRWIVDGAVKFYNAGCRLAKPACVQEATDEYLSSEDSIGQFLDECCELQEDAMTSLSDLYTSYHYWAESQGVRPYTKKRFGQMLTRRGYEQYRTNASRMWVGIALSDGL
jgi:putative DNA primase/helicase